MTVSGILVRWNPYTTVDYYVLSYDFGQVAPVQVGVTKSFSHVGQLPYYNTHTITLDKHLLSNQQSYSHG